MNSYPSIPYHKDGVLGSKVWVFDKPDGNNLRFEYSKNRGFLLGVPGFTGAMHFLCALPFEGISHLMML